MKFYTDIDINLTRAQNGDISLQSDVDAIKNSIRNISETIQGSRRMLPDFALNAYNLLFEPMDDETSALLGEYIWDAIEEWDNRVLLKKITVKKNEDRGIYNVNINFDVINIIEDENVTVQITKL